MENQSRFANAMKFGLMMGIVLIIAYLVLYLAGATDVQTGKSGIPGYILNYVISIGALLLGISEYKKSHGNYLSIGDGVIQGILIGLVGGIIYAIYNHVFITFIEPDILENLKEATLAQAEEQGQINEDSEDLMYRMVDIFMSPGFIFIMTVVMKFFLGLFVGLIGGALMKNERPYGE